MEHMTIVRGPVAQRGDLIIREGPELTAWTLVDGVYAVDARVAGNESWTATLPYPVTVTPSDLLDD